VSLSLPNNCVSIHQQPVSQEDINQIQSRIDGQLPRDYVEFLLTFNGLKSVGRHIEFAPLEIIDASSVVRFTMLNGVMPGSDSDLLASQTDYEFNERVPPNFIAIGEMMAGFARIVLDAERGAGAVMVWNPGIPFEEDGNVQTEEYLSLIAYSFAEFWTMLSEAAADSDAGHQS